MNSQNRRRGPGLLQRLVRGPCRGPAPQCQELAVPLILGWGVRRRYPFRRWCSEPQGSARWFDWVEERFRPTRLVTTAAWLAPRRRLIPLGRLVPLPTPPPDP